MKEIEKTLEELDNIMLDIKKQEKFKNAELIDLKEMKYDLVSHVETINTIIQNNKMEGR
ncbi:hypothetical protein [Geotoga petraea]|uniref:Uncharacterized protein n=1 Tax=Geotoga petraea TaxID=28234 RepID=A0A1G6LQY2_9BACT|nr:hypothetical protein [Geotoga petraea]SDC45670.1 hypothetical protein SAMN04488588_1117 [Geotoga petraea]